MLLVLDRRLRGGRGHNDLPERLSLLGRELPRVNRLLRGNLRLNSPAVRTRVLDTLRSVDANLGVTSADEVIATATEPLITRNIIVVEQDRYRVRERNVLRYYARSIAHLLSPPSSTH